MKSNWSISRMCDSLDETYYIHLEPGAEQSVGMSPQRIQELARSKLHHQQPTEKESPMKKTFTKTLLIAALAAALTLTAVAAFGGLEYFRPRFGDSAELVQDQIQMPEGAAAENDTYRLQVESLITDGYTTVMIVSVADLSGKELVLPQENPFHVESSIELLSTSWHEMDNFRTDAKRYFQVEAATSQRFDSTALTVFFSFAQSEEAAPLSVSVTAQNGLGVLTWQFPEADFAGSNYRTRSLQVSPMGFLAIGVESEVKGGLPSPPVHLLLKDGTVEVLTDEMTFDGSPDDEETVSGGGGVVLVESWQQAPLVVMSHGRRNPENEMITTGYFSRILDLNEVEAVVIEGKQYPVQ